MRLLLGLARIVALGGMLALAGCVTAANNSLSQSDIAGMKLTGVAVSFAPDARIQWEDGLRAYADSKAVSLEQAATMADVPEVKAFVQGLLTPRIKAGVEQVLAARLAGTRPVRLDIRVKSLLFPSAIQRVVIGGHRGMIADANLVDARTGALIVAYPELNAALYTGQGIVGAAVQAAIDNNATQTPVDKVSVRYGEIYRNWLLKDGGA
ncbi:MULTISPECIES: hypothetical protein [Bradyrhizobium]|uniref:DUF3313 domain-containing protein n=2 Tax=Nitrobacteraceae TaxID=41294 RepID=A0ABV4G222_9BRAD|nr:MULTISPECIES: hypothetical protein [Bradyrhizobium]MBR1291170.1 hypothetical protein [Bradyrhizobium ottawaense]PDT69309.1 hypothetical protein CO683_14165 [Bradyrhizobium ottawaense]WLB43412.1 hypothetical protein QIH93_23020 [Bradyrhizobium ottawaense]WQN80719.1 hypothetical protein U7859_27485 [Bradyrhizobium ottawaense]